MIVNSSRDTAPADPQDKFLTLGINVLGWRCLVVGGGRVGTRKALTLTSHGARVTVLSPELSGLLRVAVGRDLLTWSPGTYSAGALEGQRFVVAATSSAVLNLQIGRDAESRGILHCIASEARRSRVVFPAVHENDEFTVAVHTSGRSPRRSIEVRDQIVQLLERAQQTSRTGVSDAAKLTKPTGPGRVFIVGAGPGASDLITLRGLRAIRAADLVIYDRILGEDFAAQVGLDPAVTQIEWLGSENGGPKRQEAIHRRILEAAVAGRTVARVKSGDSFVFGRGAEEIDVLTGHGIACEVIPGVTSAVGVLSAAGYALTTRERGRSFAVTSAQLAGGEFNEQYPKADSLVVLMAVQVLDRVVDRLVATGWAASTPAVLIERGTQPGEREVAGELRNLARLAGESEIRPPAILAVGAVARRKLAVARARLSKRTIHRAVR